MLWKRAEPPINNFLKLLKIVHLLFFHRLLRVNSLLVLFSTSPNVIWAICQNKCCTHTIHYLSFCDTLFLFCHLLKTYWAVAKSDQLPLDNFALRNPQITCNDNDNMFCTTARRTWIEKKEKMEVRFKTTLTIRNPYTHQARPTMSHNNFRPIESCATVPLFRINIGTL
jgi:hypothetical protein